MKGGFSLRVPDAGGSGPRLALHARRLVSAAVTLFGIESPGGTSSLAIVEHVAGAASTARRR